MFCTSCKNVIGDDATTLEYPTENFKFCTPKCAFSWNRFRWLKGQPKIHFHKMNKRQPIDITAIK